MKDIPDIIYLNVNESFKEIESFNDLSGVTWSKERTYVDISYFSLSMLKKAFDAGIDACAESERYSGDLETFNEWLNREVLK